MQERPLGPDARAFGPLRHQLAHALNALDLLASEPPPDAGRDAREDAEQALEAFDLLDRGGTAAGVPRRIASHVARARDDLRAGRYPLARAEILRAGGLFGLDLPSAAD